jgi:hypothetical protein
MAAGSLRHWRLDAQGRRTGLALLAHDNGQYGEAAGPPLDRSLESGKCDKQGVIPHGGQQGEGG